jgi:hypothetical protein
MHPKLSVTVQVDLDGRHVSLAVTGTLTETNQQALTPLVERARTLFPAAALTVDLHQAHLPQPAAIELLARRLRHGSPGNGSSRHHAVRIAAPARPGHETALRRSTRWACSPTGASLPQPRTVPHHP